MTRRFANNIRSQYGDVIVRVDYGKKENRERSADPMPLAEFLDLYNSSDRYLVDTLPDQLWKEYNLLPCITCGGFTKGLQDAVLWFSSGGTKSFLHMDTVENINCMMSGTKEWFFVDIRDSHHVELDHKEGDYSSVDVDHVDMYAYPGLQHVPWWSAHLDTGDCMYVPYGWIHQVTSISRNIAVNIWWTPDLEFNDSDCQVAMETGPGVSLDDFQFTPAEQFRFMIIKLIENNGGQVDFKEVQKLLISEHTGTPLMDEEVFSKFDMDGDNYLTVSDLKIVPVKTFHEELEEFETGAINIFGEHIKEQKDVENLLESLNTRLSPDIEEFLLRLHKTDTDIAEFIDKRKDSLSGEVVNFLKGKLSNAKHVHDDL
ncbi:uncharacterized protein LOC144451613 isoform X3 [Glandiceps talaboti]